MTLHAGRRLPQILVLPLLIFTLGCQPRASGPEDTAPASDAAPRTVTVEEQIEFGPGSLDLPDLRVGLADASSYESKLTVNFEGTSAGKPVNWTGAYSYASTRDPLARQLKIETSGEGSGEPVLLLELEGGAYERQGEGLCMADAIDPAHSAVQDLEPAAQLPSLFGAEEAGTESVHGVQAQHFTFDERALTEAGLQKTTGELWLATEGGYVLRYRQVTTGDAGYFGEGTEGTFTYDYELIDINQPATIALPEHCPPGPVDAPVMADAANLESLPGLLTYETASSLQDVLTFYGQELPKLGWAADNSSDLSQYFPGMTPEQIQQALEMLRGLGPAIPPTATPNPNEANALYKQGGQALIVTLTRVGPLTQVVITVSPYPTSGQ